MKPAFFGFLLPADSIFDSFTMPDQDGIPRVFSLNEVERL
jgi:hypothetical protein